MESPLSFNSSENFRKKLLVRNLQPYSVNGVFNVPKLENKKEVILVDYSVIDSPEIEKEQKNQEKKLISKNKYNPNDGFGLVIDINADKNYETNFGNYGFKNTIGSVLETIGNNTEKLLYVNNLYGPVDFSSSYGNTVDINKNLTTNTNLGLYGFNLTFGSKLETFAIQKEIELITKNQYNPTENDNRSTVNINNDIQTDANKGHYEYKNTLQSKLQNNGIVKKDELLITNQYNPIQGQSSSVVNINNNKQTLANEGNYGFDSTVGSTLELNGDSQENILRTLNKYNPENVPTGFGNTVNFPTVSLSSNAGQYDYVSNGPTLTTEQSQTNQYVVNIFGPPNGYGEIIDINVNAQTISNQGLYSFTSSRPPQTAEQSRTIAYVSNVYGPGDDNGYGSTIVDIDINYQTESNKGEYDYTASSPAKTTEQSQQYGYQKNKFNSGEGEFEQTTIEELFPSSINAPYFNSDTTFYFLASTYSPLSILTEDNPAGTDGPLSQDSDLAKLGAKQLQKEFKTRVALELFQQTLGRSILTNSSVTTISGEISPKPSFDPFDILGVVTNNIPLIEKNYKITEPANVAVEALGFAAKLSGLYSPYSLIPGEYFDYPNRNFLNQVITNPVGAFTSGVGGLLNTLVTPFIDSGSERFLANTSNATKNLLFGQLFYNTYRPKYRLDSANLNLTSPKENFYVGKTKNFVSDTVSPANEIADGAFGKKNVGPVFDYGLIGQDYEGGEVQRKLFGLKSYPFYDAQGGLQGGFSWVSKSKNYIKPGQFVGPQNQVFPSSTETDFDATLRRQFAETDSSKLSFTDGSILDITQKLVEAGAKSSNTKGHVGNAINQVSKVFNDGYIELTKGSRVRRYLTPNAIQGSNKVKDVVGYEYARLFTKDRPFANYSQLQQKDGMVYQGRKASYSVLNNSYNLNIAPMKGASGVESSNIVDGKVKKYMFSIENLSWRTSNRPGFTVDDLPTCEVGPNGGRVMWFPPYELSYDDTSRTGWNPNTFLGRTEPIYTYKDTERTGTLKFKMIVDHQSVLNIIVNKELERTDESTATKVVDSFMAGCLKYDIYDLLKKYKQFNLSDVFSVISALEPDKLSTIVKETANATVQGEITIDQNANIANQNTGSGGQTTTTETLDKDKFQNIQLLFGTSEPDSSDGYDTFYNNLVNNQTTYINLASEQIYDYNGTVLVGPSANFGLGDNVDDRKSSIQGVYDFLSTEYNLFKDMMSQILQTLKSGTKVTVSIEGSTNANEGASGLGLKRAESIKKSIEEYVEGEDKMSKFLQSTPPLLTINATEIGTPIIDEENYRGIDCSKSFPNNEIYQNSVQGTMCRAAKVSIASITPPTGQEGTSTATTPPEGDLANPLAADNNNVDNTQTQLLSNPYVQKTKNEDKTNGIRDGLTKRLLRKLLTECDYFEMIQEKNSFIYDGIKSKIKNFNPAFHSMTPEGLNSRLTFLQQCMRPGDTIPTAVESGQGEIGLQYNDVLNSAFGSPPVCILRVGDFYHTKVVFESVDFKYETLDLNADGIGVQPMFVDVSLSFKMIGGHGLREPIASLQNALSFNYYANTEIYDERAEETENFTSKYDNEIFEQIKNEVGVIGGVQRPAVNDGGTTIGIVQNTFVNPQTNTITGTIRYKEIMDEMVAKTQEYANGVLSTIEQLKNDTIWGGLVLYTPERKYKTGLFDYLLGNITNLVNIFGKPVGYQDRVDKLFKKAKDDVEDDTSPILGGISLQNFPNNEVRKIKNKLKSLIDDRKNTYLSSLETNTSKLIQSQLNFIKYSDQINYVLSQVDGYKNKSGGVTIYNISGTTGVNPQSNPVPADTYIELQNDFLIIKDDLNNLDSELGKYQLIPSGTTKYNESFDFDIFLSASSDKNNVFFMIFGKEMLEENGTVKLVDSLIAELPNNTIDKNSWVVFLYRNLGFEPIVTLNGLVPNVTTTEITNGLYQQFKASKNKLEQNIKDFKDNFYNIRFPNGTYLPFSKSKDRVFDLSVQLPVVPPADQNLLDLWSTVDSTTEDFNLKKKMN